MKFRIILVFFFLLPSLLRAQQWDTHPDTWVATDDLGREVYNAQSASQLPVKPSEVGMFYYLWHGKHTQVGRPIFDVTEILKANPDKPQWGGIEEMHWWGHPVLGYYEAGDPFVLAKHLQMLADAGVDFLFFDVTNGYLYDDVVEKVMSEIDRRERLGLRSVKLCFMSYWGGIKMLKTIYNRFYTDRKYDKYWYRYQGRPLILADKNVIKKKEDQYLADGFTFRKSWAWMGGKNKDEWAWLESYPQQPGWSVAKDVPEQLSVSTAQHATTKIGKSTHKPHGPQLNRYALTDSTAYGLYFEEQWQTAHRIHPPVLMITQFNEWTAMRFVAEKPEQLKEIRPMGKPEIGESFFVDAYNAEFNRDIEPSTHPQIRDNYYMQFVSNMRKYKGARAVPVQKQACSIDVKGGFGQWQGLTYEYRDDKGDILHQNTLGFNHMDTIVNLSGRNDLLMAKVAHDRQHFYFYVSTTDNISPQAPVGSDAWLTLLLNVKGNGSRWYGYNYIVKGNGSGQLALYKNTGGRYLWKRVCNVTFRVEGNQLHLAIPRKYLPADGTIDFKWTDHVAEQKDLDILRFYVDGDVAPNGRFNYRYVYR